MKSILTKRGSKIRFWKRDLELASNFDLSADRTTAANCGFLSDANADKISVSSPKKIALGIFRYFPTGILQRDLLNLAAELSQRNHNVTIFCRIWEGELPPPQIKVIEVPVKGQSFHTKSARFGKAFRKLTAEGNFDISVAFNRFGGADFYFAADNPFYLTAMRNVGHFWSRILPRYRSFIAQERAVFSPEAKTIILGTTKRQLQAYRHIYKTPAKRCFLLPPGVDSACRRSAEDADEIRSRTRSSLGVREDEIMLFDAVGGGFKTRGVDRSIAALASLPDEIRNNTRLFIAGSGNAKSYMKLARKLGIDDRVKMLGDREDISDLLYAADMLIHPARNEASGVILLEALACGCAVVCTANCGYSPFVAAAGQTVMHLPFHQRELNRGLLLSLSSEERLDELKREAEAFSANADFYRRHKVAADIITGTKSE
jgi:UDP-glucose:(heptosyl)LPS alpha-1,3-glucosyltransferase